MVRFRGFSVGLCRSRLTGFASQLGGAMPPAACQRLKSSGEGRRDLASLGKEGMMTILWIILVVLAVIGLLALLGRGRFWGTRRY
jgi:hypothetical protein